MNFIPTAPITNHSASYLPWWTPDLLRVTQNPSTSSTKNRVAAERLQATQECGFFVTVLSDGMVWYRCLLTGCCERLMLARLKAYKHPTNDYLLVGNNNDNERYHQGHFNG